MSNNDSNSFVWFLAGLGLGAVVGVLYAPRSGEETRRALLDSAEQGRRMVDERSREARQQVAQVTERGREFLHKQREQFNSAVEAGKQAYREATTETSGKTPTKS